jgi:Pyridoxamine 5'-phosphate oxidase
MGILTDDMKRVVSEQQLGFCATVCPGGSPNLSPKGSTRVWDDDHLFFADICSPQTVANLRAGSLMEVNVIVVIEVDHAEPLVSPVHDDGSTTEADVLETHRARFARLHKRRARR